MRIRPAHLLLCGVVLLGPVAACGKDDKKDDASSTTSTTEGDTSTTKAASGGNTELTKYCADVADFSADARKVLQSKDADDLKALEPRGDALATRAAEIQPTLDEADLPELLACQKQFTDLALEFQKAFGSTTG